MKIKDALENYYTYSASLSSGARQLSFAGIAVVWIFVVEVSGEFSLPASLHRPLLCFVLSLAFDLLQYLYASAAWGLYHYYKEDKVEEDDSFKVPEVINWPTLIFFWFKAASCILGYAFLLLSLWTLIGVK